MPRPRTPKLRDRVLALAADVGASTTNEDAAAFSIASNIGSRSLANGLAVTNFDTTTTAADGATVTIPVEIFTISIGDYARTSADFDSLAEATGGGFFTPVDAAEVVDAVIAAIKGARDLSFGMTLSNTAVDENTAAGFVVGALGGVDEAEADLHSFTLIEDGGGRFALDGNHLVVAEGAVLDFETTETIEIVVRATDSLGGFVEQTFTVRLNDQDGIRLVGTPQPDALSGSNEEDIISGGLENDEIWGGDGDDVLRGDLNSRYAGGRAGGDDIIYGGAGNDRIGGKGGDDWLLGEAGDDQIWGDDGDDILRGGLGNDTLTGDDFSGGEGRDTFVLAMGEGTDTIVDFERGEDAIGLAGRLEFGQLSQSQRGDDLLLGLNAETLAILQGIKEPLTAVDFVAVI